jgi:hypothetical protein
MTADEERGENNCRQAQDHPRAAIESPVQGVPAPRSYILHTTYYEGCATLKRFSHPLRSSREDRKECGKIRIPEYRTANFATVS